jgi:hypothetical protein
MCTLNLSLAINAPGGTPIAPISSELRVTVASGNWGSPATWAGGIVPSTNDWVEINHAVTVENSKIIGAGIAPGGTPAVNIKAGGSLVFANNAQLTVKGDFATTSATNATRIDLTQGSGIEFLGNQNYTLKLIGQYPGTVPALRARGTASNRAFIRSASNTSGRAAIVGDGFSYSGLVDLEFCTLTRLNAGGNSITATPASDGSSSLYALFRLVDCIFDACGAVNFAINIAPFARVTLQRVLFKNTVSTACLNWQSFSAKDATGVRLIDSCDFDKHCYLYSPQDLTLTNNTFLEAYTTSAGATDGWDLSQNNLVAITATYTDIVAAGDVLDEYWIEVDPAKVNPHFIQASTYPGDTSQTIRGVVFEHTGTNADGDCITIGTPVSAVSLTVEQCIVLPNAGDANTGTLISALGNANCTISANDNTVFCGGQPGIAVGETYAGHAGMFSSIRGNIFWDSVDNRSFKVADSGTNDTVSNLITSGNLNYNLGFNMSAGSNSKGYNNLEFSSGAPGANDVEDVNPLFVDPTRDIASWDLANGGTGTYLNALSSIRRRNDVQGSGYSALYTVPQLLAYVREGYVSQSAAVKSADHNNNDIGAMPYRGGYAIAYPNGGPTDAWFSSNVAEAVGTGWDGYVIEPVLTTAQDLKTQAFDHTAVALTSTNLANFVSNINGITWGANRKPKYIFVVVNGTAPSGFDWNNLTHRQRVVDNFTALGVASNSIRVSTGIKVGMLFNNEFTASIWRHDSLANPGARTYVQSQTDVRATLSAAFDAYWNANPQGSVSIVIGSHYANRNSQVGVQSADYGLVLPGVLGILDAQLARNGEYFGEYGRSAYSFNTPESIDNLKNNATTGFYSATGHQALFENDSQRSRYGFDVAFSSGNKSRRIVSPALVSGNVLTFRDANHFFQVGDIGTEIYIFGLGVRNITAVSGATVTFDGTSGSVPDEGFACSQKPFVVYVALATSMRKVSRFVFEYFLGDNKDATDTTTITTRARIPLEMRNAFTRAIKGLDSTGVEDIELSTSGVDVSDSALVGAVDLTDHIYEFQFETATGPLDDKSFKLKNAAVTGTLTARTSPTGDTGVDFLNTTVGANFAAIASDADLEILAKEPTWVLKFKTPATLATGNFCARYDDTAVTGAGTEYFIRLNSAGTLTFFLGGVSLVTVATLAVNTIYVVFVWKEGTTMNIQINQDAPEVRSSGVPASVTATAVKETFGAIRETGIAGNRIAFTGECYFTTRFNRPFTAAERLSAFNAIKEPAIPYRSVSSYETESNTDTLAGGADNSWAAVKTKALTEAATANSKWQVDQSFGLSSRVRFFMATNSTNYVDDALDMIEAWIAVAQPSSTFTGTVYQPVSVPTRDRLGWLDTATGIETQLWEGYYWRHATELLWRMQQAGLHTNPTWSARWTAVRNFIETHIWGKWFDRKSGTAPIWGRTYTHMASHGGPVALFGRRVFANSSRIAECEEYLNKTLGTATPYPNFAGLNYLSAFENHNILGANGIRMRQPWNASTPIEDTSHFNHVASYLWLAWQDGYVPTGRVAGYLDPYVERIRRTMDEYIWNNGASFREFISDSTTFFNGFMSEGMTLYCSMSGAMQLKIAEAPIPTGTGGNFGPESRQQWLATSALTRTFHP